MATKAKRVKATNRMAMEIGSGNVFQDLGLPDPAERLAKAELARVIRTIITDKDWTQRHAAKVLSIAPPDVSDLMRGKLARFSQERLVRFLNALDMNVRIQVGPRKRPRARATVTAELVGAF